MESVEGYGFTDVVGIKDNYIYYWEVLLSGKTQMSIEDLPLGGCGLFPDVGDALHGQSTRMTGNSSR